MRFLRKLHQWLGLIVGVQVLLWAVSGVVFAWLDHHEVSGEHSARPVEQLILTPSISLAEPATWISGTPASDILDIRLASMLDRWVWRLETVAGVTLRSAETGEILEINAEMVRQLSQRQYIGQGRLVSVAFHAGETLETRDAGATWEARFDDANGTTFYFSADDGRLVETRNGTWRLFDFFWMLHTMDYKGRDDFNNPWVITVGMAALWLSVSGLILLLRSFRREDFAFLMGRRRPG